MCYLKYSNGFSLLADLMRTNQSLDPDLSPYKRYVEYRRISMSNSIKHKTLINQECDGVAKVSFIVFDFHIYLPSSKYLFDCSSTHNKKSYYDFLLLHIYIEKANLICHLFLQLSSENKMSFFCDMYVISFGVMQRRHTGRVRKEGKVCSQNLY